MKEGFGGLMDFLTPKSDLLKVGLAGLLVAGVITFRKQIEKAFEGIFKYIGGLKDIFDEEGMKGLKTKIGEDFREKIANPSLAKMGLMIYPDGSIGRVPGSWLDLLDPFTGPTNIFKTLSALWTGIDPYTGNAILPEWMIKPINEFKWWKKADEFFKKDYGAITLNALEGLWKGEWNGESFLPEWMTIPINEMSWYKSTAGFMNALISDPKSTLKALWEGKDPVTGKSFLPEWMTTPISEMDWFKDSIANVAKFIYNEETGATLGIDFSGLSDLLPTLQEIADSIMDALPEWMHPKSQAEKQQAKQVKELEKMDFFDKEWAGKSEIDHSKINQASNEQLQALLALESDDLHQKDIDYIKAILTSRGLGGSSGPSENYGFDDSGSFTGEGLGEGLGERKYNINETYVDNIVKEASVMKAKMIEIKNIETIRAATGATGNVTIMTDAKRITGDTVSTTQVTTTNQRVDHTDKTAEAILNMLHTRGYG
jgi:hypothetical protein